MDPLVKLAKDAVESYTRERRVVELTDEDLPPALAEQAGVFVCLKIRGMLRGCIGTFEPAEANVARETVRNAISAATCDPRFEPVAEPELADIAYSVDVLTKPVRILSTAELDPRRYGVIVQSGGRRGLLLPDLEGVDTAEQQVSIAMRKAGIAPGSTIELFRFEVRRHQE